MVFSAELDEGLDLTEAFLQYPMTLVTTNNNSATLKHKRRVCTYKHRSLGQAKKNRVKELRGRGVVVAVASASTSS